MRIINAWRSATPNPFKALTLAGAVCLCLSPVDRAFAYYTYDFTFSAPGNPGPTSTMTGSFSVDQSTNQVLSWSATITGLYWPSPGGSGVNPDPFTDINVSASNSFYNPATGGFSLPVAFGFLSKGEYYNFSYTPPVGPGSATWTLGDYNPNSGQTQTAGSNQFSATLVPEIDSRALTKLLVLLFCLYLIADYSRKRLPSGVPSSEEV